MTRYLVAPFEPSEPTGRSAVAHVRTMELPSGMYRHYYVVWPESGAWELVQVGTSPAGRVFWCSASAPPSDIPGLVRDGDGNLTLSPMPAHQTIFEAIEATRERVYPAALASQRAAAAAVAAHRADASAPWPHVDPACTRADLVFKAAVEAAAVAEDTWRVL